MESRQDTLPTRILLVEDDPIVAVDIEEELKEGGFEVIGSPTTVNDALDALAKDVKFDLAVLDINLGGETVYPVADELVARDRPFIFLTGYQNGFIPPSHAAMPRFTKPLTRSALQAMLAYLKKFSGRLRGN
jgi:CheY-like chemotaxis protein